MESLVTWEYVQYQYFPSHKNVSESILLVSTLSSKSSKRRHQRVMVTKVPSSSCV